MVCILLRYCGPSSLNLGFQRIIVSSFISHLPLFPVRGYKNIEDIPDTTPCNPGQKKGCRRSGDSAYQQVTNA
jgi:hypothetical protein